MAEQLPQSVEVTHQKLAKIPDEKKIESLFQHLVYTPQDDGIVTQLQTFLDQDDTWIDVFLNELPTLEGELHREKEQKKIHDQRRGLIQRGIEILRDQVIKPFVQRKGSFWKTPAGHVLQVNAKVNTKDGDLVVEKERPVIQDGIEDKHPSVNPDFKRCNITISCPARQTDAELAFFRDVVKEHQQVTMGLRISKVEVEMTSDTKATALSALRDGRNLAWRVIVETPPKDSTLSKGDRVEVLSWKDNGDVAVKVGNAADLLKEGTYTIEQWCHLENPKTLSIHLSEEQGRL